jgi:hypothetical protein
VFRRWPVAAIAVAALGVATTVAASPNTIVGGAIASQLSKRLSPNIGGCPVFPGNNAWNTPIASFPRNARSDQIISKIQSIGTSRNIHPDVGSDFGIPFVVVSADQPLVPITYTDFGDESDPGPFPIPLNAPVEAGSDAHVLVLQQGTCQLFELFAAQRFGAGWSAASGAKFDLTTGALRTIGFTSADAAGLPILPGLVRYEEVAAGVINHAIRVTFSATQKGFVLPATHSASNNPDPTLPAMGMRLRLSAGYNIAALTGQAKVIAVAMQQYGLIVADNGSNWFFQGAPNPLWNNSDLDQLKKIPGTEFEVVDTGPVQAG